MRTEVEIVIRREIEQVFGRSIISSRDCIELSEEIFKRTQQQLNPNTLRRFFGLVKADYPPSQSTLSILSKYCGFYSVEDVYTQKKSKPQESEIVDADSLLYYFDSLFREMHVRDNYDRQVYTLVKHTIRFLNDNPSVVDRFQRMISKTKNGQEIYFEQFVNVDKLNDYFGEGLRYYAHEKNNPEATIFSNAIQVYRYWLTDNVTKLKQHYELIGNDDNYLHLKYFVAGRYFAAQVFYAHVTQTGISELLINIYKYHSMLVKEQSEYQRLHFEYVIAEALALTSNFPEALFYLDHTGVFPQKPAHQAFFTDQNYKLLKALCLYRLGRIPEAGLLFDELKPSDFLFITKRISGILYHYLASGLRRKNLKYRQSQSSLIKETGFVMLEKYF